MAAARIASTPLRERLVEAIGLGWHVALLDLALRAEWARVRLDTDDDLDSVEATIAVLARTVGFRVGRMGLDSADSVAAIMALGVMREGAPGDAQVLADRTLALENLHGRLLAVFANVDSRIADAYELGRRLSETAWMTTSVPDDGRPLAFRQAFDPMRLVPVGEWVASIALELAPRSATAVLESIFAWSCWTFDATDEDCVTASADMRRTVRTWRDVLVGRATVAQRPPPIVRRSHGPRLDLVSLAASFPAEDADEPTASLLYLLPPLAPGSDDPEDVRDEVEFALPEASAPALLEATSDVEPHFEGKTVEYGEAPPAAIDLLGDEQVGVDAASTVDDESDVLNPPDAVGEASLGTPTPRLEDDAFNHAAPDTVDPDPLEVPDVAPADEVDETTVSVESHEPVAAELAAHEPATEEAESPPVRASALRAPGLSATATLVIPVEIEEDEDDELVAPMLPDTVVEPTPIAVRPRHSVVRAKRLRARMLRMVFESAAIVAAAVALVLVLRVYVVETFTIPTTSMVPTLLSGDRVLVDRLPIALQSIHLGDIIAFHRVRADNTPPYSPDLIKRVVGLPREQISSRGNHILINGRVLREPWLPALVGSCGERALNIRTQTIPKNHFFVIGDCRGISLDSRSWGTVPRTNVIGKVIAVVWQSGHPWFHWF